jgi:hypothetical protein
MTVFQQQRTGRAGAGGAGDVQSCTGRDDRRMLRAAGAGPHACILHVVLVLYYRHARRRAPREQPATDVANRSQRTSSRVGNVMIMLLSLLLGSLLQPGCGSTGGDSVAAGSIPTGRKMPNGWHSAANYDVTYDCPGPCKNDTETCHCHAMTPQKDEASCRNYCDRSGCVAYAYQVSAKPYANGTRQCWWRTDIFFNRSFTWGNATSCPPPIKPPCKKSEDVSGCKLGTNPATKSPWVPGCGTHPPLR